MVNTCQQRLPKHDMNHQPTNERMSTLQVGIHPRKLTLYVTKTRICLEK
jgi:hypothetical protein